MDAPRIRWSVSGAKAFLMNNSSKITQLSLDEAKLIDSEPFFSHSGYTIDKEQSITINLPLSHNIYGLGLKREEGETGNANLEISISNNSSDGTDGTWELFDVVQLTGSSYSEKKATTKQAKWIRIKNMSMTVPVKLSCLFMFGLPSIITYYIYEADGITQVPMKGYQAEFPVATNVDSYHQQISFRIKNVDTLKTQYSLSVKGYRVPPDPIEQYFTLSTESNPDKKTTITTPVIAPGDLSEVIKINLDLTIEQNPADGFHLFYVDIIEINKYI